MRATGILILAGGRSRRMGEDKAKLKMGEETLLMRLLREFEGTGDLLVSVAKDAGSPKELTTAYEIDPAFEEEITWLRDEQEDQGPLAGLSSALSLGIHEWIFAVASDMPFADSALLEKLRKERGEAKAVIPVTSDGQVHPLAGLYHRDLAAPLRAYLKAGGRKALSFLETVPVTYVPVGEKPVTNVNDRAAYERAVREDQRPDTVQLVFLALCVGFGMFAKKLIGPLTNVITDFIRLPGGGAAAAFSLMFLVFAAGLTGWRWAGTACGFVQGALALALGLAGYQGAFALITYTIPGIVIDLVRLILPGRGTGYYLIATAAANTASALGANLLVFHFSGRLLLLWLLVAASFGVLAGLVASLVDTRLQNVSEYRRMRRKALRGAKRPRPMDREERMHMERRQRRIGIVLVLALFLMTAVAACGNREEAASLMTIKAGDTEVSVTMEDLDKTEFTGEQVNGKGEVTEHTWKGVLLKDLLADKEVAVTEDSTVTITAADNFGAEYTGREVLDDGTVYLAVQEDGEAVPGIEEGTEGVNVVVFGDKDSKRCVRMAVTIEVK